MASPRCCVSRRAHAREAALMADAGETASEPPLLTFCTGELKAMWALGWPIAVSMFCRFAMFSMDAAFVGHVGGHDAVEAALPGPMPALAEGSGVTWHGSLTAALWNQPPLSLTARRLAAPNAGQKEYLAAASLSDMITNLLVVPLLALAFGLNPLVAQAMGSGNLKMAGTWLQLALFCVTVATIPLLAAFFFVGDVLHALEFDPHVCELAGTYAKFSSIWVIPNGWYVAMRFYFQAQGKARPAMYCGLVFVAMNALLLWVFVFGGPADGRWWLRGGLGFVGAAVSISCSRTLQCLFYWLYMFVWKRAHQATWPGSSCECLRARHLRPYLAQVLPQVGTMLLQFFINQSTTLLVARLGILQVAASSAATQATMPFTLCLLSTFSALGAIRVGMKLGQGNAVEARRTAWLCLGAGAGMTVALAAFVLPARHEAMALMTSDPKVRALAAELLTPILLNFLASGLVQTGTGGILASQGRTQLSTLLAIFFELPLSLGSIAVLVLVFHADVRVVYWLQASVSMLEALVVVAIVARSDWERHAAEARRRNEAVQRGQVEEQQQTAAMTPTLPNSSGGEGKRAEDTASSSSPVATARRAGA